ncbi:MAG: hypothetical protein V4534_01695 [Myxococcota bacterium]
MNTNLKTLSLALMLVTFIVSPASALRRETVVVDIDQDDELQLETMRQEGDIAGAMLMANMLLELGDPWYGEYIELLNIYSAYVRNSANGEFGLAAADALGMVGHFERWNWSEHVTYYSDKIKILKKWDASNELIRALEQDLSAPNFRSVASKAVKNFVASREALNTRSYYKSLHQGLEEAFSVVDCAKRLVGFWSDASRHCSSDTRIDDAIVKINGKIAAFEAEERRRDILVNFDKKVGHLVDFERGNRGSVVKAEAKAFADILAQVPKPLQTQKPNRRPAKKSAKKKASNESVQAFELRVLAENRDNRLLNLAAAYEESERRAWEAAQAAAQRKSERILKLARPHVGGVGTVSVQ